VTRIRSKADREELYVRIVDVLKKDPTVSIVTAAKRFDVSTSVIKKLIQKHLTGRVDPGQPFLTMEEQRSLRNAADKGKGWRNVRWGKEHPETQPRRVDIVLRVNVSYDVGNSVTTQTLQQHLLAEIDTFAGKGQLAPQGDVQVVGWSVVVSAKEPSNGNRA
jgi:transposase